jgi:hypothetical protein
MFCRNGSALADQLLRNFSFLLYSMLNPDGADMYTLPQRKMRLIKTGIQANLNQLESKG